MGLFSRKNKIKRWSPNSLDDLLENIASGQNNFENIDLRWKEFRLDRYGVKEDNKTTITFSQKKNLEGMLDEKSESNLFLKKKFRDLSKIFLGLRGEVT